MCIRDRPTFIHLGNHEPQTIEWNNGAWTICMSSCAEGKCYRLEGPCHGNVPPECDSLCDTWGPYSFNVRNLMKSTARGRYCEFLATRLYSTRSSADVTIRCGFDTLYVHSFLLADSPVFERMLQSPMTESASKIIEISDFPSESVKAFFEVWYTGQGCPTFNWGDILLLADKYILPCQMRICLAKMNETMTAETIASYITALNLTQHIPECEVARERMIMDLL